MRLGASVFLTFLTQSVTDEVNQVAFIYVLSRKIPATVFRSRDFFTYLLNQIYLSFFEAFATMLPRATIAITLGRTMS